MRSRSLLSLLLLVAMAAPSSADLWSPSTWIPSLPSKKSKNVSVAKSNKKPSAKSPVPNLHGITPAHDFLANAKAVMSPTGPSANASKGSHNSKKPPEKPSMFKSMFASEPPQQPRTVSEWMAQKRPQP